jgi:hypothetical protein
MPSFMGDDDEDTFVVQPSERKFPEALDRIRGDIGFTKANIICENLRDPQIIQLAAAMKKNSALEELALYLNKISCVGMAALAESIGTQSVLRVLNLGANNIKDEGARAIGGMLMVNKTITKLVLDRNKITEHGARALAMALERNTSLKSLYLHQNQVNDEGARALGNALAFNNTLRMLFLDDNKIGDPGTIGLAAGLRTNPCLQTLHLNQNKIGDKGCKAIAAMLYKNRSLVVLRLSNNVITDRGVLGVGTLGDMFSNNCMQNKPLKIQGLDKLYLDNNLISENAAKGLMKELHRRNKDFGQLHMTTRSAVSLAQRAADDLKHKMLEGGAAQAAPLDGEEEEEDGASAAATVLANVHSAVERLRHPSEYERKNGARGFQELMLWSESQRASDIGRLQEQKASIEGRLNTRKAKLSEHQTNAAEQKVLMDAAIEQVRVLVESNEFVSMAVIHAKRDSEKKLGEAMAGIEVEKESTDQYQNDLDSKEIQVLQLQTGNEVQIHAPDAGAIGALLAMVQSKDAGDATAATLVLTMNLKGIRFDLFKQGLLPKVTLAITSWVSDELELGGDNVKIDLASVREEAADGGGTVRNGRGSQLLKSEAAAAAAAAAQGEPLDAEEEAERAAEVAQQLEKIKFEFDIIVTLQPGSQSVFLRNKFAQMQEKHLERTSKYEMTDAVKFALQMENYVLDKNKQYAGVRFGFVSQKLHTSDALSSWPERALRAQLEKDWPRLLVQFLDEDWLAMRFDEALADQADSAEAAAAELERSGGADGAAGGGSDSDDSDLDEAERSRNRLQREEAAAEAKRKGAEKEKEAKEAVAEFQAASYPPNEPWLRLRETFPPNLRLRPDWTQEEGAWALAGLLRGNVDCQEQAASEGVVEMLLNLLVQGSDLAKAAAAEAMAALAMDNPLNTRKLIEAGAIPLISGVMGVATQRMRNACLSALLVLVPDPKLNGYTHTPVVYTKGVEAEPNPPLISGGRIVEFVGDMPKGLVLDPLTGVISGNPTQVSDKAIKYKISATNYRCTSELELPITIIDRPPKFVGYTAAPMNVVIGERCSRNTPIVSSMGGTPTKYTCDNMPPGLNLNEKTGAITGALR